MDPTAQQFGEVLKEARLRSGLSQQELSFQASIHWTYVSQLERGLKNPTLSVVLRLAAALDTSAAKLVADVERRVSSQA